MNLAVVFGRQVHGMFVVPFVAVLDTRVDVADKTVFGVHVKGSSSELPPVQVKLSSPLSSIDMLTFFVLAAVFLGVFPSSSPSCPVLPVAEARYFSFALE